MIINPLQEIKNLQYEIEVEKDEIPQIQAEV